MLAKQKQSGRESEMVGESWLYTGKIVIEVTPSTNINGTLAEQKNIVLLIGTYKSIILNRKIY